MDLASNIANILRLTMLHNNVFEKLYNSFSERKSWLWMIVTISLGLQMSIFLWYMPHFINLLFLLLVVSILYNVIFF